MRPTILKNLIIFALFFGLNACAGDDIHDAKDTSGRNPVIAEAPNQSETVRGNDNPPIVTLELGDALHEHHLSEGDELPGNIIIPTTNLNAVPITAALQAVLAGTDVSLSWDTGSLGDRLVTVFNLSGPLPKVVEKICSAARVFCIYRHGSLELEEKETFVISLPPIARASGATGSGGGSSAGSSAGNSMVDTISQLVGGKVQVDDQGGNIIYSANVDNQSHVRQYLEQLRNGRPLVVLQLYVWEVTLNKENAEGVNWNSLKLGQIGPGFGKTDFNLLSSLSTIAGNPGSVSLGAVTTGSINANALFGFLSTQGLVQTISNPQITFVSGSNAEFKVGGKQRYISQVGTLSSNVSGTTPSSSSANTVTTDSIDTGLTIDVAGSYENGVIFANMDLALTNLVSLNPTNSGSGTIDLPSTTDEKVNTAIRVRPGDNLVMAGLVTSADTKTRQGLPLPGDSSLPMYGDAQAANHELVIVVQPSVVLFSDKAEAIKAKKKEDDKQLPDAVFIDKDGSKTLTVPAAAGSTQPPAPTTPTAPPDRVAVEPNTSASSTPGQDGAPVDRRLMQRGFSHAFDNLLGGTSSTSPQPPALSGAP